MSCLPRSALQYFSPKPPSLTIGAEKNHGAYGTVHSGLLDGKPVAVKHIHSLLMDAAKGQGDFEKMLSDFQHECQLLQQLDHPHVVGFKGAFYDTTTEEPILVMELMNETLQQYLKDRKGQLSRQKQLQICVEIVRALHFLHTHSPPVMHRDLTDKNILISFDGLMKIGDLGQSKLKTSQHFSTAQPGAIPFMPPEAMMPHSHYNEKLDIFSLGVLMLEVATQELPRVSLVGIGTISELQRHSENLSKLDQDHPLRHLILSCLKDEPTERPDIVAIHTQLLTMVEGVQVWLYYTTCTNSKANVSFCALMLCGALCTQYKILGLVLLKVA